MTKEEIAAGLKNALDRGSSIEDAVQSFVNSGYNANEVMEAASLLGQGVSKIIQPAVTAQAQSQVPAVSFSSVPIPPSSQLTETTAGVKEAKKSDKMKWTLIISLVLLLVILAGSIIYLTLF